METFFNITMPNMRQSRRIVEADQHTAMYGNHLTVILSLRTMRLVQRKLNDMLGV